MQQSVQRPESQTQPPNDANQTPRLRAVTGNHWPRKSSCGCGFSIPREPVVRYDIRRPAIVLY